MRRQPMQVGSQFSGTHKADDRYIGSLYKKYNLDRLIRLIFANGEQGFAYDPNDLTDAKLNWRRNLLTWTEDFTAAAWGKVGVALVKDNIANPFGALGVFKLCPTVQTPTDCDIRQTLSKKGSGVFSVYLKKAERNFACINIIGRNPTGSEGRLVVDLTTKAINKFGLQRDFIIQEVGDGWLRVALLFENFVNLDVEVRVQVAENINTYYTTGDGTKGIYAYAPQLEFFTDAPSTYQPITDFNTEFIKQFPLHALFQDAAGTIPVTAAGQPVGLMLDKSKGLALGVELITQPLDFTNWTKTVAVTSFTANSFTTNAGGGVTLQLFGGSSSKAYCITMKGTSTTVGTLCNGGTGSVGTTIPMGAFDIVMNTPTLASFGTTLYIALGSAGTITVDSISVKELAGNHAYQTVSASRPILQQTPTLGNELITNGDFSDGTTGWSSGKSATLSTAKGVLRVTNDPVTPEYGYAWTSFPTTVGKKYYVTARRIAGSANNVSNMHIGTSSVATQIYNILGHADANKLWLFTATTATTYIGLNAQGNALSGWVEYDDISVKEVTGYRTDQNYLAFDGVDDFLQTNSIDFTATDKVSLFAGVRKLSDANRAVLVELGTNGVNSFLMQAPTVAGDGNFAFTSGASFLKSDSVGSMVAPISAVLTAKADIRSSYVTLIANGGINTPVISNQGIGNYQNAPLYIGRRGGTSLPFNGHLYSLIGISRLTTDSETLALEKAIAKATGVTLNV